VRRTGPLLLILALGVVVLFARLYQIQVTERPVWAARAARMVRSGRVVPYVRGALRDATGVELVRDEATYRLELVYRGFRRNHPLGVVAHALSALEQRAVPLTECLPELDLRALELVALSPAALEDFAGGAALAVGELALAACDEDRARDEQRPQRASDVHFYVQRLCGVTRREAARLRELREGEAASRSYLVLVAETRGETVETARAALLRRLADSRRALELLAERVAPAALDGDGPAPSPATSLAAFVAELEQVRGVVEELVAAALFREAAGFSPGRLAPQTLFRVFDLEWIARRLRWDEERLLRWTTETRRRWLGWRDDYAVAHLVAEFLEGPPEAREVDRLFDLVTSVYRDRIAFESALDGEPEPWRSAERTAVFDRLDALFELEREPDVEPLDGLAITGGEPAGWRDFELLARSIAEAERPASDDDPRAAERRYRAGLLERRLATPAELGRREVDLLAHELVVIWEQRVQARLAAALGRLQARALEEGTASPTGRIRFARGRLQRALESARDVLRDYGDRALPLATDPSYEVVYLLTRFPEAYAGFEVRDTRVRVRTAAAVTEVDDVPGTPRRAETAAALLGVVSVVDVAQIQRQREQEQRLRELRLRTRTAVEDRELVALVGEVLLRDEAHGVSGLEGDWDAALRGRNGYKEHRGLQDVYGRGRVLSELRVKEDGADLDLTLHADLQRAVEWMLEHPWFDPEDPSVDRTWFAEPVGAAVCVSREGDVLAAASVPNGFSRPGAAERAARFERIDRTLRKPRFQPPGSVFKPFAAAYALAFLALDPLERVACSPGADGWPEFGGVRCWLRSGHGDVDLSAALKGSCNAYFAWLGERFGHRIPLDDMARRFGFGEPTGVRQGGGRPGLAEDVVEELFARGVTAHEARLAANGLAVVEATPMQVARATLALATGELRELRLVSAVGGEPLPRRPGEPLAMDVAALELVRAALVRVTSEPGGTAHRALNEGELGVRIAAKTGSADLVARRDLSDGGLGPPKHTWVAGWVPADDPELVFVVFLDRARATSSHTAVYVARQLLRLPELRAWLAGRGVALEEVE